jgi:hypothetical protein
MPKFLEAKLKREYGEKSAIPYKVMNSIGAMKGNKETAKGAAMEEKHEADMKPAKVSAEPMREMRIEIHRGPKKEVTGFTVHHHMVPKPHGKSSAFYEDTNVSHPFAAGDHGAMMAHVNQHMKGQIGAPGGAQMASADHEEPDGDEGGDEVA